MRTISPLCAAAALCSGVTFMGLFATAATSAPCRLRSLAISGRAKKAAKCRAVNPSADQRFAAAGSFCRISETLSALPAAVASKMSKSRFALSSKWAISDWRRYNACIRAETPEASLEDAREGSSRKNCRTLSTSPACTAEMTSAWLAKTCLLVATRQQQELWIVAQFGRSFLGDEIRISAFHEFLTYNVYVGSWTGRPLTNVFRDVARGKAELHRAVCCTTSGRRVSTSVDGKCHR